MEETLLRWISTLGFPIVAFFVMVRYCDVLTKRNEKLTVALHTESTERADKLVEALNLSTKATEVNTSILRKFGSDPMQICRIESVKQLLKEAGRDCPSDSQIKIILDRLDDKRDKQKAVKKPSPPADPEDR